MLRLDMFDDAMLGKLIKTQTRKKIRRQTFSFFLLLKGINQERFIQYALRTQGLQHQTLNIFGQGILFRLSLKAVENRRMS